jgi:hypothetical protein
MANYSPRYMQKPEKSFLNARNRLYIAAKQAEQAEQGPETRGKAKR